MNSPPSFSLLTEPWIQCEMMDGGVELLSITEIFDGRRDVKSVRGDSPAQDYSVLRVLLSIYWRAHHPDTKVRAGETFVFSDWFGETLEDVGDADDAVIEYLENWNDRFDLLHPEKPFMQVADLHTKNGAFSEIQRIVPEAEDEYFTMRAGTGRNSLSFAEAARWLIYAQAYDYSGIKSGAEGDARVKGGKGYPIGTGWTGRTGGTVVVGDNLRHTLLLNTTQEALTGADDKPVWERDPDTSAERHIAPPAGAGAIAGPQGPNDLATWQGRRIRMYVDGDRVNAVLVSNGDQIPNAGANVRDDPMTPYRYSPNQSKKGDVVHYALPFDPNRTMWRSLEPLISLDQDPGFDGKNIAPIRPKNLSQLADLARDIDLPRVLDVHLVSVVYGPQASSVATTVVGRIEIPVALLETEAADVRAELITTVAATRDAAIALGQFGGHLLEAAGGAYEFQPDPTDGILSELEPRFIHWLAHLRVDDVEKQAQSWQTEVRREILEKAAEIMRGAGPKALAGREISSGPDGSSTRILSAGSAYRMLQNRLKKILYLIDDPAQKEDRTTSKEKTR
ncbi:type I-E CRISPR-associated protein Cse1/CasA [Corynebacterium sp. NPDC060344]|uniref:type I-E CRISPR-associated protein Cse1/CasA n=1 Tax=Corynebacterium sp. NPDC060344 TaxID=3347101 RepID=UPI003658889E